MNIINNSVMY